MINSYAFLFVQTANLGDLVSSSGLILALSRRDFQTHGLKSVVLVRTPFLGLFGDEPSLIEMTESDLKDTEHFQTLVDLDSSSASRRIVKRHKSKTMVRFGRFSNWQNRLKSFFLYTRQVPKNPKGHIVFDYEPLSKLLGLESLPSPQLDVKEKKIGNYGVLHVEAFNPLRSLPEKLVDELLKSFRIQKIPVVLVGLDLDQLQKFQNRWGSEFLEVQSPSLSGLKDLMASARFFIGPDSGPLHLAAALGVKSVGVYGPNVPRVAGPLSKTVTIVEKDFDCRPCNQNKPCPYQVRCLNTIAAQDILKNLE